MPTLVSGQIENIGRYIPVWIVFKTLSIGTLQGRFSSALELEPLWCIINILKGSIFSFSPCFEGSHTD